MAFGVQFWGVRGSIACPSPQHVVFGGNTSCIELFCDDQRVILDAGTGIRGLGRSMNESGVRHAHILLTHTHWDHINGFPFFEPGFRADHHFEIMAGHLGQGGLYEVFAGQMAQPTFPVPLEAMKATLRFSDFSAGDKFRLGPDLYVLTAPLNHPNGATGYRMESSGKSICYVTDTEHTPGRPDERVLGLIEGADLVIYDCTYTDDEFEAKRGWGHSTWQEGVRLCQLAGVKKLAIFHHDPEHEDEFMRRLEVEARAMWSGATVAREGMRLSF